MKNLFIIAFLSLIYSCQQPQNETVETEEQIYKFDSAELAKLESERIAKRELQDSIRLDEAFKNVLEIAKENIHANHFTKEFEVEYHDEYRFLIIMHLEIGHLISNKYRHLFIRQNTSFGDFVNLYLIENESFKLVFSRQIEANVYTGDTIKDVNGDGLNDFLIFWSPQSGCCTAFMCDVALSQSEKGDFTNDFRFINVNFSPKDKLIRGLEYGHCGNNYTYQWNNFQVDTLEIISLNSICEEIKQPPTYRQIKYKNNKPFGKPRILIERPKVYQNLKFEGERF